jgi:hypothetical protein
MSAFIMDREKEIKTDNAGRVICVNLTNHHESYRSGKENVKNDLATTWLGEGVLKTFQRSCGPVKR